MSLPKTTFIYALVDPRDNRTRYIGKADDVNRRLRDHLGDAPSTQRRNKGLSEWIKALKNIGLKPLTVIIQEVPRAAWEQTERYWISKTRLSNPDLLNLSPGGGGCHSHSAETRARIGIAIRGIVRTAETRAKISVANGRRTVTLKTRQKIGESSRGRSPSVEARAKIAFVHKGKKVSAETRAKQSAALTGRKRSPETIEKIRTAALNRPRPSDDTRKKMSASQLALPESVRIKKSISAKRRCEAPEERKRLRRMVLARHNKMRTLTAACSDVKHELLQAEAKVTQ